MFFRNDDKVKINSVQVSTFVGADTRIEGTIITKSSVRIDGQVVGGVVTDATVILSKNGKIEGNVIADNIVIAGVVNGNLQISDKTNIEPSGEVYGDISTGRILVDENSIFQGNCSMNLKNRKNNNAPLVNKESTTAEFKEESAKANIEEAKSENEDKSEAETIEQPADNAKKTTRGNKKLKVEILE